jgi:hypothetical protein
MNSIRRLLVIAILFLFVGQGFAAEDPCQQVRFSDVGWTDITATTALTSVVLEGLGYTLQKSEWEIWKDWHQDAARSTGIEKNLETFETTVENSDHLKRFYENQLPFYRIMYAGRIQPKPAETGM